MLTLANANQIAASAHQTAAEIGIADMRDHSRPRGPYPRHATRERASLYREPIARAKAMGCLGMGFGGREIARRAAIMPAFYTAVGSITDGGIAPVAGGVLIRDAASSLIGAIGISGETAENDERCAAVGIAAVGRIADTGVSG